MTALQLGDRIANGTRSTVYALGMDYVVKVPLAATPDSWIQYEAIYTAAVCAAGAPAPRFVETARYEGRLVSVYERLTGPSMWEYVVANPGDAESMGRVLGQLHGELFDLVPPVKLPDRKSVV